MQLQYFDHYRLLNVPRDASNAEIEAAFRLALENVPRKGIRRLIACARGRTDSHFDLAFKELSDSVKRQAYDTYLSGLDGIPLYRMY